MLWRTWPRAFPRLLKLRELPRPRYCGGQGVSTSDVEIPPEVSELFDTLRGEALRRA